MKIQIMSDLHMEFKPKTLPQIDAQAEVIVLAGDISNSLSDLRNISHYLLKNSDAEILMIAGNHEFYGKDFPNAIKSYRKEVESISNRIKYLENQSITIGNKLFVGATLWSDYNNQKEIAAALISMNDFRAIRTSDEDYSSITPEHLIQQFKKSTNYIYKKLKREKKQTIVITHHAPSFKSINPIYANNTLNGAFVSNLEYIIQDCSPSLWIHGHCHTFFNYMIDGTRIVCNPYGYPFEKEYSQYREKFTIEV